MTSLFSGTVSPSKDGTSSLPRRQNSLAKPPLRALYDLLIAPMEGVSGSWDMTPLGIRMHLFFCLVRMRTITPPPADFFCSVCMCTPRALHGHAFFAGCL